MSDGTNDGDHAAAERDHLEALFFSPAAGGSHGTYTPGVFDLHLVGGDDVADRLVHHHEVQHVVLTTTTAWGGALLVTSQIPHWRDLFGELLDRCRLTHESYATYMSCSVVSASFGSPAAALAAYPQYVPLAERLARYLAVIPGDQRRSLAASALARVCMQTPILQQMITSWPRAITPAVVRAMDVPDERLNHLLRQPDGLPFAVVAEADAVVTAEFGPAPVAADQADGIAALDERFDAAWARWEDTVFDALAARLAGAGASIVGSNDHVPAAAELAALARRVVPELNMTVVTDPLAAEQRLVPSVLAHARLWLSEPRRPARMVTAGEDITLEEAISVTEATTRVEGRPNLVLHARLPTRLLAGYGLPERDREALGALAQPVLVSRTIADDGEGTQTDVLWLVRWAQATDAMTLAELWAGRGDLTCCVAASCLADARWRAEWLPVLQQLAPIVWLIDVPIGSLATEFGAGRIVHGLYVDLVSAPTGAQRAVAFKVIGWAGVWLALADEVGINLITQQVAELPGIELRMTGADWTALIPALRLVLLDLQRTESHTDLRALDASKMS